MEPIEIYPTFIFRWNSERCSSKLNIEENGIDAKCSEGAGSFKTVMGDRVMVPGWRYRWSITISHGSNFKIGITRDGSNLENAFSDFPTGWAYYRTGQLRHNSNSSGPAYGESYGAGDTIGIFFDMIEGELSFSKNEKYFGTAYKLPEFCEGEFYPAVCVLNKDDAFRINLPIPED